VTFTDARERPTSLAVDESSLEGNLMLVTILDENDGENGAEVLLRLPRVGLAGEWAAVVLQTSMVDADAPPFAGSTPRSLPPAAGCQA
jgi:hypothetical protein